MRAGWQGSIPWSASSGESGSARPSRRDIAKITWLPPTGRNPSCLPTACWATASKCTRFITIIHLTLVWAIRVWNKNRTHPSWHLQITLCFNDNMVQVKVAPVMSVLLHLKLRADASVVGGFLFKLCPVYCRSCSKQPSQVCTEC